jgi:hypothetical protein
MAAVVAYTAQEAGLHPLVLDLSGHLSRNLSGHFDTYDYRSFLYDAFRLGDPEPWHSQLAAAAYSLTLDLTSEEEAIVDSVMQEVAFEGTLLSPVSLHDVLGSVEGFRGVHVDRLKGRIGALRLFDAADDLNFSRLMRGDVMVDFHGSPYPQAGELAVALFIAKILSLARSTGDCSFVPLLTDAHRLFRTNPRPLHSNRLLEHLLASQTPVVFSSPQGDSLNPAVINGCPARMYSGDAWHNRPRGPRIHADVFLLEDTRSGNRSEFIPRRVPWKSGDYVPLSTFGLSSPQLCRAIIEQVEAHPLSTPRSVVEFLTPEFLSSDVSRALASLEEQGYLLLEPKESGSGPRVFSLTVTEKGRSFLTGAED